MGYSSRYHVASLAAVFLALAIGILIGAAFGADVLEDVGQDLEQSLKGDLDDANAEIAGLEDRLAQQARFAETVYPALTGTALPGRRIALVAFGGRADAVRKDVAAALAPTGAELSQVAVVREPPDVEGLAGLSGGKVAERGGRQRRQMQRTARRAGASLVAGGPFYDRAREALLSAFSGSTDRVDGVVVVRERPEMEPSQERDSEALETALIDGLESGGVPVVGAERTGTEGSSIPFLAEQGLTTVDDTDLIAGRVALVYALRGAQGRFGVAEDADELLPALLDPPALRSR